MERTGMEVAIIGMAGRFPKSKNIDEFWSNLVNSKDCITHFSKEDLMDAGIGRELLDNPMYVKAKGYLEGIEYFDANYFGLSAQDVVFMDPQVRLFIELINEVLENAGINPQKFKGPIGLYGGAIDNFDWKLKTHLQPKDNIDPFSAGMNSTKDLMTTLASYIFDLKGPSYSIQTACSTSMVAIHTACRSVLSGECEVALAGGVSVSPYQKSGHLYSDGMFFSPDGKIRSFDANASGFVFGYGGGVVALKPLEDAIEDGDYIHGVIKGSAINNDGRQKVGYAAPSVQGQADVITEAIEISGIDKSDMRYLETHGAATPLGDSVEIRALKKVYGDQAAGSIGTGSVKSNIGHLDAAAGVAGFIKTVLSVKNRMLPATINFDIPNENLDLISSPFFIPQQPVSLSADQFPVYAGVSSMGIGGTNVHVILEEYKHEVKQGIAGEHVVVLSAKTSTALVEQARQLYRHLNNTPNESLANIAHTLQEGRKELTFRRAITVDSVDQLLEYLALDEYAYGRVATHPEKLVLDFSDYKFDQVSALSLYDNSNIVRKYIDQVCSDLSAIGHLQVSSKDIITHSAKSNLLWHLCMARFLKEAAVNVSVVKATSIEALMYMVAGNKTAETTCLKWMANIYNQEVSASAISTLMHDLGKGDLSLDDYNAKKFYSVAELKEVAEEDLSQDKRCLIAKVRHDSFVTLLGQLWENGIVVNWKLLHGQKKPSKLPLPTYPFERSRYWIDKDIKELTQQHLANELLKKEQLEDWFYHSSWSRTPLKKGLSKPDNREVWMVLSDNSGICHEFLQLCENGSIEVRQVKQEEGLTGLHQAFREFDGDKLNRVINFWQIDDASREFDTQDFLLDTGYNTAIALAKAIQNKGINQPITIHWVATGLFDVVGGENINPWAATVLGPLRSIPQEQPIITCQELDVNTSSADSKIVARQLWNEILQKNTISQVAFRNGHRWEMDYRLVTSQQEQNNSSIVNGGVYVLSGGLGNIGLTIADYLTRTYDAQVILLSRTALPTEEQWDNILTKDNSSGLAKRINALRKLKEHTSKVDIAVCDVAKHDEIESVITNIESEYGRINGIFHAAGSIGEDAFMPAIETPHLQEAGANYRAKVLGTINLYEATKNRDLDFCLLMSSISSALGGLGFSEYAATSHFLENFALWANRKSDFSWSSVAWDSWPVTGGKEDTDMLTDKLRMSAEEAGKALEYALNMGSDDFAVIHSPTDLNTRVEQWVETSDDEEKDVARAPRPEVSTEYTAPVTPLEKDIASIWMNVLGLDKVGLDDNFFELGGNSLKMIAVASNIHKKLKRKVEIKNLFKALTIRSVRAYLESLDEDHSYQAIERAQEAEYYSLTPAMTNIYMQCQFKNIGTVYNIANGLLLKDQVDVGRIKKCAQALVDRHEPLRTSFHNVDGIPMQKVHKDCEVNFEVFEVEDNPGEVENIISKMIRPFDLSEESLFRVGLVHVANKQTILVFDLHHIICDGVTISVLAEEFTQLYSGKNLEPLSLQLKDYIAYLQNNEKEEAEKFWLEHLAPAIPTLQLQTDYERSFRREFEGTQFSFEVDKSIIDKLDQTSTDKSVTLFVKLMSITYILLSKYSSQEDIIIGSGVAGRNHPDVSRTTGLFFNAFPVRINQSSEITYEKLMEEVKELMLNIYEYESCDMERVYKELQLQRKPDRNFLYDVVFLLQNYQASGIGLDNTEITNYPLPVQYSQNDITFHAYQLEDNGIKMVLTYSSKLFKEDTIKRMAVNFESIASQVAENSEIKISNIEIGDIYERAEVDMSGMDFDF
ncbi:SDR family NAD(P)-dependent oxidoreductase [Fulvivirga sediminis]|uniref:SDR family NAD(P)-dependent oxidoreductase n=1 Tax=Fulvivirga sediminis TaxID=2803949 RepID=A0A937K1M5_9BACT|nr:SDR family NAD(P)-dependent oxidoreductase [Fulvivirga sediminis]MBL3658749.1 SDR family NAD(P)-dependent oxidoreductase [Fulvivirga sediminis]